MKRHLLLPLFISLMALAAAPALAASVTVKINGLPYTGSPTLPRGAQLTVGDPFTVTITIQGGMAADPPWLKHGDDVQMNGAGTNPQPKFNYDAYSFFLTAQHAGKVTFPAFDVRTKAGQTLHAGPITLAVAAK
jgi:hypothetical protein